MTTKEATEKRASGKKTITKKTIVEKTTTKKTTAKKEKTTAKKTTTKKATAKRAPMINRSGVSTPPLSMRTWRLLHVKAVGNILDTGLSQVGGDVADGIKQRVFAFLGPLPAGIRVITEFGLQFDQTANGFFGNSLEHNRRATSMHIVNGASGMVEMKCTVDLGRGGPWAWSPSGTKSNRAPAA